MEEKQINKISELLSKYERENLVLKAKRQFNLQQANFTMKRFAEELGSYFLKEIKSQQIKKVGNQLSENQLGKRSKAEGDNTRRLRTAEVDNQSADTLNLPKEIDRCLEENKDLLKELSK